MNGTDILSPFDGTVALYHVEIGDIVKKGDSVLEVEAMKTFMRVVSPADGKVTWMAELGEFVGHGEAVAHLEMGD